MKRNKSRPIPTASSQFVGVLCAVTLLVGVYYIVPYLLEELKSGNVYTVAVIVGDGAKVHRSDSPPAFWMNFGLQALSALAAFVMAILTFREVVLDHTRRVAARKKHLENPSA
jgi:hypothetical protein